MRNIFQLFIWMQINCHCCSGAVMNCALSQQPAWLRFAPLLSSAAWSVGTRRRVRWTVVSTKTRQNSHRRASRWRRRCEWRRWASSLHCRSGKRRNWSPRGQTIYRPDPNSWEGPRSLPGGRTKEHVLETDCHHSWLHRSSLFLTHIASRHDVSARTDHGGLDEGAPPVALAAHAVPHHGQQGLLQLIWHRPVGWGRRAEPNDTHIVH